MKPRNTYDVTRTSGFTLIEAVVAASVFAFVVVSLLGVYMSNLRLDSRSRAQRAISDNARFIMEFLAKEVRNGRIDYTAAACGGVVTSTSDLCLVNQDGESEHIYGAGTDLAINKGSGTSNLNSTNVKITKLAFLVAPSHDPLTPSSKASGYNEQPHVTVILEITSTSNRDPVKLNIQSTLSENYYPSRQ
jgi:Tfp pilus assembly protein PilW